MTDYTLPPLPPPNCLRSEPQWERSDSLLEKWGRQCAEDARAPLLERIAELESSRDFYKRRCDLLQQWQARMRDPERTLVCDVLANGQVLPDPNGTRYGLAAQCGQPVAWVEQREPYLDGSPNPMHTLRWNHDVCPSCEDDLPVGSRLFLAPPSQPGASIHAFQSAGGGEIANPLERLRFFLSIALKGQDWLDVEPLLDALPVALPDQTLCRFYGVDSWEALVTAQEEHVLKLQDAARRNVKPWEDTFPPTLLPKYLRESGLDAPRALPVGLPVAEFAEAFDQLNSRTERAKRSDLTAQCAQPVALPDGWVAVPREPTDEMKLVGNEETTGHWGAGAVYRAMIAAAPEVPRG